MAISFYGWRGRSERLADFGNLHFAESADGNRQRDEMRWFEIAARIAALGSNAPQEKITDGFRHLWIGLFGQHDGVFVIDEWIRVGTWCEYQEDVRRAVCGA